MKCFSDGDPDPIKKYYDKLKSKGGRIFTPKSLTYTPETAKTGTPVNENSASKIDITKYIVPPKKNLAMFDWVRLIVMKNVPLTAIEDEIYREVVRG